MQDEFHQKFCPWDVSQVIPQTMACPGGSRLILHETITHHFLLFQRVVLPFIRMAFLSLLYKQKQKTRGKCENGRITKHGKCRNMACKTIAAFLSPQQGFLESLLETSAHEMFLFCFLLYLEVCWTPFCCNMARMGLWSPLCQLDGSLQTAWTAMCKETNGMLPSGATCTAPSHWEMQST